MKVCELIELLKKQDQTKEIWIAHDSMDGSSFDIKDVYHDPEYFGNGIVIIPETA